MLLTDLCNRPTTRAPDGPFDFRAPWLAPPQITECFAGVTRLLPRDTRPPCGNPVPARTRLTARRRASVTLVRIASGCVSPLERRSTSSGDRRFWRRSPPCAGLFGRSAGSTSVPLTPLSSAAARRLSRDDVQMTVQIRFHPSHVNATGLPESERLSSTSALRRVLSHFAVYESPPPISRLRRQRSGFRRFFTPPSLSRGGARPARVIRELFAHGLEGPRAARRLLQSIRSTSTTTFVRAS